MMNIITFALVSRTQEIRSVKWIIATYTERDRERERKEKTSTKDYGQYLDSTKIRLRSNFTIPREIDR